MATRLIHLETHVGDPIVAGDAKIIPMSKSLRFQLPGLPAGLIWNRPSAVVTLTAAGEEQVLPVRDVTRQTQLALLGIVIGMMFVFWMMRWKKKPSTPKEIVL